MIHTPPIDYVPPTFEDTLFRHIACALRLFDKKDDMEIDLFINSRQGNCPPTRLIIERMVKGWIDCKCDTIHGYGRALCYSAIGVPYDCNHFSEIGELHYQQENEHFSMKDYWDGIAHYVKKSLDGLI